MEPGKTPPDSSNRSTVERFFSGLSEYVFESRLGVADVQLIDYVSESTGDQVSVHHGHMPIIEFVTDSEAKGIWAMEDRLYRTKEQPLYDGSTYLHGFGHYRETYAKLDAGWRIRSTQLTRLRVEMSKVL